MTIAVDAPKSTTTTKRVKMTTGYSSDEDSSDFEDTPPWSRCFQKQLPMILDSPINSPCHSAGHVTTSTPLSSPSTETVFDWPGPIEGFGEAVGSPVDAGGTAGKVLREEEEPEDTCGGEKDFSFSETWGEFDVDRFLQEEAGKMGLAEEPPSQPPDSGHCPPTPPSPTAQTWVFPTSPPTPPPPTAETWVFPASQLFPDEWTCGHSPMVVVVRIPCGCCTALTGGQLNTF